MTIASILFRFHQFILLIGKPQIGSLLAQASKIEQQKILRGIKMIISSTSTIGKPVSSLGRNYWKQDERTIYRIQITGTLGFEVYQKSFSKLKIQQKPGMGSKRWNYGTFCWRSQFELRKYDRESRQGKIFCMISILKKAGSTIWGWRKVTEEIIQG